MSWFAFVVALWAPPAADGAAECTYQTYSWDVNLKKGVGQETVKKTRAELTAEEKDPTVPECTVCREDQVELKVEGLPAVTVCRLYADQVKAALEETQAAGFQHFGDDLGAGLRFGGGSALGQGGARGGVFDKGHRL